MWGNLAPHRDSISRPSSPLRVAIPTIFSRPTFSAVHVYEADFPSNFRLPGRHHDTHTQYKFCAYLINKFEFILAVIYCPWCYWISRLFRPLVPVLWIMVVRGELSYLAPLGSENISAPYFKQCFLQVGVLPPRQSNTTPPSPKTEITNILFYILNFASIIKF